eukprot:CAMPEP_0116074052 /NCGR_PEP_ID=MMETSP0322-20121206/15690_1 /TAXON_ID=163516 /ORGANISM="Leptocylindrus danicus var. apora, Strain B651" /LENGTH=277 /DNA_ID=CAMNT_0003563607 /DNA_START=108 /DNA_END=938 /DNA_ORIENTATION=-
MKLKHLESSLSSIDYRFRSPKVELEQYPTCAHLAAAVVWTAHARGDVGANKQVLDLGCGTGMLTIATAIMAYEDALLNQSEDEGEEGSNCSVKEPLPILSLDCCSNALEQAAENCKEIEVDNMVEFLKAKLSFRKKDDSKSHCRYQRGNHKTKRGKNSFRHKPRLKALNNDEEAGDNDAVIECVNDGIPLRDGCVDTVLTNPPFGTKQNAGIDLAFLKCACRLSRQAVYSFHKSSTREHVLKKAKEWHMGAEIVAAMKFDIPKIKLIIFIKKKMLMW